ncbi:MAG TPA: tRNA lysidine(34) synthetase TilS, partial [Rhizobiales bacterium]|nr:tRNA lysidine(34) synthetase TilS [Hyphomicrobiales bacterium]
QAAAREARLSLLADAAIAAGTDVVLTGHTLDDQAETVAMRAGRGPGIGLAGMAPATLVGGSVWIVRPLLETTREALRNLLRSRGVGWIDDPSNENPAFERVRKRQGGSAAAPAAIAEAGRRRCDLADRAARLLDRHAASPSRGLVRLDPSLFEAADREAAVHALRALLAAIGGTEHLPDAGRTEALYGRARQPLRATLSRTVVDARRAGVFLHRELRNLPGPAAAVDGAIWDGRYRLLVNGPAMSAVVPAGRMPVASDEAAAPPSLVRAALAAEPALPDGGKGAVLLGGASRPVAARRLALPWSRFLPCFDVPLAQSVARVVGAPPFRSPPCHGHKGAKA